MKRVGYLFDKVIDFDNLKKSFYLARKGKKQQIQIQEFLFDLEYELLNIQQELQKEIYQPGEFKSFIVNDVKTREIFAAPFRDRIVHHAICRIIEPHFEKTYIFDSYACRKGKGQHKARERAQFFARKYRYYLKCDIQKFFASVNHNVLKDILRRRFKDKKLLRLLHKIIDHHHCETGLPIGNLTSQHFANVYLNVFDHFVKEKLRIKAFLRYMDDFVIYANDKQSLWETKLAIAEFLRTDLHLEINEKYTFLRPVSLGIPFLGFVIFRNKIRIQKSGWKRFCHKFNKRQIQYLNGEITIEQLTDSVASLVGHIRSADTKELRRIFFAKNELDF